MKLYEEFQGKTLNLALIQWYDFKFKNTPYKYRCPHIQLVEIYNIIELEAIHDTIHIIPRFDRTNEYYVNNFIF